MNPYLVFDLETQRDSTEVGGWGNIVNMKMSVGVLWDSEENKFFTYHEDTVEDMITHLLSGKTVVGFNHIYFDYVVLTGYREEGPQRWNLLRKFKEQSNFDILIELKKQLNHRIKLNSVASATLNSKKSADGLEALQWFKEYQMNGDIAQLRKIEEYCQQDVSITRDIYKYGLEKKVVYYESKYNGIQKIQVDWENQKPVKERKQPTLF